MTNYQKYGSAKAAQTAFEEQKDTLHHLWCFAEWLDLSAEGDGRLACLRRYSACGMITCPAAKELDRLEKKATLK